MSKIKPTTNTTGKRNPVIQKTKNSVPVKFIENQMEFHQQIASGEQNGRSFTVHIGLNTGTYYLNIDGLKGSIPKIGIEVDDLIAAALYAAEENDLFE